MKRRLNFVFLLSFTLFFDMVSVGLAHTGEDISGGFTERVVESDIRLG